MNPHFPIDLSLAEVLQWREQLRLCCQGMSLEEELAYLHREVEQTLRKYGLKMIPISSLVVSKKVPKIKFRLT